jgi:hypothetical protein
MWPARSWSIIGGDDDLGLLRQRGALVQHAADLLTQRAHVPAFDAAHLGIEVAGERVLERQERMKVGPAQLL